MQLDRGELLVIQRRRLVEDALGDGELADVVQQTADRELAEASRCEPELFAHLNRAQGDPARVLLRRFVLVGEQLGQRTHARAEEGLFLRDEIRCTKIPDERA